MNIRIIISPRGEKHHFLKKKNYAHGKFHVQKFRLRPWIQSDVVISCIVAYSHIRRTPKIWRFTKFPRLNFSLDLENLNFLSCLGSETQCIWHSHGSGFSRLAHTTAPADWPGWLHLLMYICCTHRHTFIVII